MSSVSFIYYLTLFQSAQKGIPEGRVFELNKQRLAAVGSRALQDMLDRRDWSGLPQHSAFALMKGTKTASGINQGSDTGSVGDGDVEAEMDLFSGMEAYYSNTGDTEVVNEVGEGNDNSMSYRSIKTEIQFEAVEEVEEEDVVVVEAVVDDLYNSFDVDYQQQQERAVEGKEEEQYEQYLIEDAVGEDRIDIEVEVEDVQWATEEEGEFDSLLLDVDKWLSEN